jgi:hypothetical protein
MDPSRRPLPGTARDDHGIAQVERLSAGTAGFVMHQLFTIHDAFSGGLFSEFHARLSFDHTVIFVCLGFVSAAAFRSAKAYPIAWPPGQVWGAALSSVSGGMDFHLPGERVFIGRSQDGPIDRSVFLPSH